MFYKLGLFEDKIALWNGNNVENLSDFDLEFLTDLIILASEVKPAAGISEVEHEFTFKDKGSDKIEKLFARKSDVDFGLFFGCHNVTVLFVHIA